MSTLSSSISSWEEARRRTYERRFSAPRPEIMNLTVSMIWDTFGIDDFSKSEFQDSLRETTEERPLGERTSSLQHLIDAGHVIVHSRGRFCLSDSALRKFSG